MSPIGTPIPRGRPPWPTYYETPTDCVADLAETLGLVESAFTFETQNENRPEVVEGLVAVAKRTFSRDPGSCAARSTSRTSRSS